MAKVAKSVSQDQEALAEPPMQLPLYGRYQARETKQRHGCLRIESIPTRGEAAAGPEVTRGLLGGLSVRQARKRWQCAGQTALARDDERESRVSAVVL